MIAEPFATSRMCLCGIHKYSHKSIIMIQSHKCCIPSHPALRELKNSMPPSMPNRRHQGRSRTIRNDDENDDVTSICGRPPLQGALTLRTTQKFGHDKVMYGSLSYMMIIQTAFSNYKYAITTPSLNEP